MKQIQKRLSHVRMYHRIYPPLQLCHENLFSTSIVLRIIQNGLIPLHF